MNNLNNIIRNSKEYFEEWHIIINKIESITGLTVFGFDPDILLCNKTGDVVHLPLWFIEILIEGVNE